MIFWINTTSKHASGASRGYPFEAKFDSVEEIANALAEKGLISGCKLVTGDNSRGQKVIVRRIDWAIGKGEVGTIQKYDVKLGGDV